MITYFQRNIDYLTTVVSRLFFCISDAMIVVVEVYFPNSLLIFSRQLIEFRRIRQDIAAFSDDLENKRPIVARAEEVVQYF